MQRSLLLILLLLLDGFLADRPQQVSISGDAGNALVLRRGTTIKLPYELSGYLSTSFTFDCWLKTARGGENPIVSRAAGGNNMFVDFVLFVNPSGHLVFFMGNGEPSSVYGVLLTLGAIPENRWVHVGFGIKIDYWVTNPSKITLYFDGKTQEGSWGIGNRQQLFDRAVFIGSYVNENTHFFDGHLDEIRFWDTYLPPAQVIAQRHFKVASANLLAYYSMFKSDEKKKIVFDSTTNNYHGQFIKGSGEGFHYEPSEVKIHKSGKFVFQPHETREGMLNLGNASLIYFIETLPSHGTLISPEGSAGKVITASDLPYKMSSHHIRYSAPAWDAITHFRYYVLPFASKAEQFREKRELESTQFWIKIGNPLDCENRCNCYGN